MIMVEPKLYEPTGSGVAIKEQSRHGSEDALNDPKSPIWHGACPRAILSKFTQRPSGLHSTAIQFSLRERRPWHGASGVNF